MSRSMRHLIVGVAVLVAASCAVAVLPPAAAAWKYSNNQGRPGSVTLAQVSPFEDGRFTTYGPFVSFMTFDTPYVGRSPATSGAQVVQAYYIVQRWNGSSWYQVARQDTPVYTIPAGRQGVSLPKLYRSPTIQRGYFRVLWLVGWDAAGGGALGGTTIVPSRETDFRCQQMVRPCESSGSWVRIGRANALGGGW
jgi:hypothetical protein